MTAKHDLNNTNTKNKKSKNTVRASYTIDQDLKNYIDRTSKELGIDPRDLIVKMADAYKKMKQLEAGENGQIVIGELEINNFGITEASEVKEVKDALINSNSSLIDIAKDGLLWRSRYINGVAKKQSEFENMKKDELNKTTTKGSANYKIEKAIQAIMDHNDRQDKKDKQNKVYISKSIVFKLTGSNRQTINKYFDQHKYMDKHNRDHELNEKDNRKGKGYDFKNLVGFEF